MPERRADRVRGVRQYGGVLIVTARINGWDFQLMADTGAAWTAITRDVAELLGIDLRRPLRRQRIWIAHRQAVRVPVVRLDEIRVGGHRVRGLEALILQFPEELRIDGLLGVNFLERFRPTFEFDTATLVLRPPRRGSSR
jgi:clan AA aspartic protease (TIGR02281 family)